MAIFHPCGKSGDHPEEDLVKPGYEPDMKVQNPNCPSISVATHTLKTKHRNLVIFTNFFSLTSGD